MNERTNARKPRADFHTRNIRRATASANKINTPFPNKKLDYIDWDAPEYAITPDDPRWILPDSFDLGAHPWYQELDEEEKIRIGMYRYAQVARVGSEFEEALISGIALRNMWLPSGSAEKRYSTHEAEEEQRHILMFDEFVHRTGTNPEGAPNWFRNASYLVGPVAKLAPVAFWSLVLSGEEPIDRTQRALVEIAEKNAKEAGKDVEEEGTLHPIIYRVMKLHIEEEARHIGFADDFLHEKTSRLSPREKKILRISLPMMLRLAADVMLKPSEQARIDMDIPKWVVDETWWNSEHGQASFQGLFKKTLPRLEELDLIDNRSRLGKLAWKKSGIDLSVLK